MKHAGRAIGKFLGAGLAGTAKAAVTGGLGYYGQKALAQRVSFLQQHPLAGPVAMMVLGHVGKKKFPIAGTALIGAGTYAAAMARDMQKMGQPQPAASAGTNALIEPDDIRALISPNDIQGFDLSEQAPSLDTSSALNLGL
jgi:hypothetical protein